MKQFIWGAAIVAITGMAACDNANNTDSKELAEDINERRLEHSMLEDDAEFAVWAADEGLMAMRLGELAVTRAADPQVKQLAEAIAGDHSKAMEELKSIAETKGFVLPVVISNDNQADYDRIAARSGADFEKEYIDYTVREHKKLVNKFRDEADDASDPDVRTWINEKIPVLQQHLQHAEATQETLKK